MEKAIEHNTKVFLMFVDFCKAYDSVPRQVLRCALQKYGILENLIALVCSFHEGMLASVTAWGEVLTFFSDEWLVSRMYHCFHSFYFVFRVGQSVLAPLLPSN